MQSIAETCVRFDAAHLSINLVSEIAVPMFTTLIISFVSKFVTYINMSYFALNKYIIAIFSLVNCTTVGGTVDVDLKMMTLQNYRLQNQWRQLHFYMYS